MDFGHAPSRRRGRVTTKTAWLGYCCCSVFQKDTLRQFFQLTELVVEMHCVSNSEAVMRVSCSSMTSKNFGVTGR